MGFLNPWQLMLWIAGLELISVPLIIFTANTIVTAYFRAKTTQQAGMIKALGEALEKAGNNLVHKKEDGQV